MAEFSRFNTTFYMCRYTNYTARGDKIVFVESHLYNVQAKIRQGMLCTNHMTHLEIIQLIPQCFRKSAPVHGEGERQDSSSYDESTDNIHTHFHIYSVPIVENLEITQMRHICDVCEGRQQDFKAPF